MSLFKRGDVYWSQFFRDGVRFQQSTGVTHRRAAEQVESKLKEEAQLRQHNVIQADSGVTVGELAARFVANGAKPFHLDRLPHLLAFFSDVPVVRLTKGMTNEYRSYRHSQKRITEATINRDLACLRRILFWALDESLILRNPLDRLKLGRERRIKARVLGVTDEKALLEVAPPHLRRMIIAGLYTGMRRGEILNQQWEHVDFERAVLYVTRSKTVGGEAREIPLAEIVLDTLKPIRQTSGPVFGFRGKQISTYKTAWLHAIKRAVPYHLRFHDLRHTCNTRMMEAGVVQEVRKAILGHSCGREINARYSHVETPLKRAAIRKLEAWVQQQKELHRREEERTKKQEGGEK